MTEIRREEMQQVMREHMNALFTNGTRESYRHFLGDEIPKEFIEKSLPLYDGSLYVDDIVAGFDLSFIGNFKKGLLFSVDGFYHRVCRKTTYIRYCDIRNLSADGNHLQFIAKGKDYNLSLYPLDATELRWILAIIIPMCDKGQMASARETGKVRKGKIPKEKVLKCNGIIHAASAACGGVGAGLAQIPVSDCMIIMPIQIGMIVSLGAVFEINITESAAKSILTSLGATVAGTAIAGSSARVITQAAVGWVPVVGNAINTVTAATITEAIGWAAVKHFHDRWLQDQNKGRVAGMKDGYNRASREYEDKLRKQAEDFLNQRKDLAQDMEEYEKLVNDMAEYIRAMKEENGSEERVKENEEIYDQLRKLRD